MLSFYYMITGQKKEAVDIMEKALQVDPLSLMVNQFLADAYFNAGRTDDALKQAEWLLDMHPQMRVALELKGWCIGMKGDWKKAAEIFEEVYRLHKASIKRAYSIRMCLCELRRNRKSI